jgi:hypothetical protein
MQGLAPRLSTAADGAPLNCAAAASSSAGTGRPLVDGLSDSSCCGWPPAACFNIVFLLGAAALAVIPHVLCVYPQQLLRLRP